MTRAALAILLLILGVFPASAQRVLIIQGTASHKTDAERNIARRAAEGMARTLRDYGLGATTIPDEAVSAARLAGISVAILPYNHALPDPELAALRRYVAGGGRLIVCYSGDQRLANLMGLKLGPWMPMAVEGQWASFRFRPDAPAHVPARLQQTSRNLRPAYPASPDARIIADWEMRDGKPSGQPAWVQSPQGFWMSHVLDDDGDPRAQQQMLLAFLGHLDPSIWRRAAPAFLAASARFHDFTDFERSLDWIAGHDRADRATAALDEARALRTRAEHAQDAGQFPDAIAFARRAQDARVRAYALTLAPAPGERRGIWDHAGTGLYPGDWNRTCRELRARGITDLFINVLWPGVAHYPSDVLPRSDTFRVHGDQVAACLDAARANGMKVHAWKICWRLEPAPPALLERMRHQGRLQVTDRGATIPWLCPSHPDNLQYEKDAVREVLTRYPVDGIHLDYIRYRDSHACFCAGCRERFEAFAKQKVAQWPEDVRRPPLQARFESWRAGRISRLVQDIDRFGRRLRPNMELSAAVYGRYPLCARSIGQDWGQWVEKGIVDFVCPMNYTEDLSKFSAWTAEQMALPNARGHIWPGIGVTAAESRLDAVGTLDQIAVARAAGAAGYVLFDLNPAVAEHILPQLSPEKP